MYTHTEAQFLHPWETWLFCWLKESQVFQNNSFRLAIRLPSFYGYPIVTHYKKIVTLSRICIYRTKIFLEQSGCRTRQPGRTWLLGPGAVLVLIQNNSQFWANGTNQTKGCYRDRKPVTKKLLVRYICIYIYTPYIYIYEYMYVCIQEEEEENPWMLHIWGPHLIRHSSICFVTVSIARHEKKNRDSRKRRACGNSLGAQKVTFFLSHELLL